MVYHDSDLVPRPQLNSCDYKHDFVHFFGRQILADPSTHLCTITAINM
jgi:hypothetical protein